MGQSLNKIYIHIVFSTKHRVPLISKEIEEELFSYLGGICKNLECNPIQIGGHKDHIHILCLLSKKIALMDLIEKVKTNSSKWIKTKGKEFENFYWQNGYGTFSVNPTDDSAIDPAKTPDGWRKTQLAIAPIYGEINSNRDKKTKKRDLWRNEPPNAAGFL